jgi:hypothetical protein
VSGGLVRLALGIIRTLIVLAAAWGLGSLNRDETRLGFFALAKWLVLVTLAAIGATMLASGRWTGALYLLGVATLLRPWWLTTRVFIPRGWWRTAYALTRSSTWSWHDDPAGGALVAAAWAGIHARDRDRDRAAAFVEARCENAECGAAHLLATGLAASARGRDDDARRWIESLADFEGEARPRLARRLAVQWLAADAARRGAWSSVARFTGDRDADAATVLLCTVARRVLGIAPVPTDDELERAWRAVPGRARWRPLVDRARAGADPEASRDAPGAPTSPQPARSGAITVDLRRDALLAHARLLAGERPSVVKLLATAESWDAYLGDRALLGTLRARAAQLGAKHDPVDTLRARVERELTEVALRHRLPLGEDASNDPSMASRVRRAIHQRLLDELDLTGDALHARVTAKRALAIHEEWREYLAIRGVYNDAVAMTGPRLQRLAYAIVNHSVCALAVWLWNDRRNRVHAHQMFLWLLAEARKADDAESILLHTRNVAAGR